MRKPFAVRELRNMDDALAAVDAAVSGAMEEPQAMELAPPPILPALIASSADVGRLTSEAVLQSYEAGAKSLEALRDELQALLRRNDDMVAEANEGLKQIDEVIATCRENGKLFAARIAASVDMIAKVRSSCTEISTLLHGVGGV